jgi:hypothetical protein
MVIVNKLQKLRDTVAYLPEYHFVSVFACHVTTFKY